ncbi:MAG: glycosyltransferase [bacterium]|nr:glycosyltransferase [bacterium]
MIFVTVGTTKFPFDRLVKAVDNSIVNLKTTEKLIVQKGTSKHRFLYSNAQVFQELPFDKMIYYFSKARVVICSGGPGSIFLSLKHNNHKPLVVPRSKKFSEHVDEHEIFFAKYCQEREQIKTILPGEDIVTLVSSYISMPERLSDKREIKPSAKLIDNLNNYTLSIINR